MPDQDAPVDNITTDEKRRPDQDAPVDNITTDEKRRRRAYVQWLAILGAGAVGQSDNQSSGGGTALVTGPSGVSGTASADATA